MEYILNITKKKICISLQLQDCQYNVLSNVRLCYKALIPSYGWVLVLP